MTIITQNARQRMLRYFEKHSAEETAIRYKITPKTVYKWKIGMTERLKV